MCACVLNLQQEAADNDNDELITLGQQIVCPKVWRFCLTNCY